MPSITKTLGLILVAVHPAVLTAQAARPSQTVLGDSGAPPTSHALSFGPSGGFGTNRIPVAAPHGPQPTPGADVRQAGGTALQRTPTVVPAVYGAALFSASQPPASGVPGPPSGETGSGVPLAPRGSQAPLPLPPPGSSGRTQQGPRGGLGSVVTVASSLALVLGVFFLVAWGMRRAAPAGGTALPGEVFEVLGRAPMASRQQVYLLRCGNKLVLVSVTAAGAETLTEITQPAEVDRLAGLCRQAHPNSATAAFRQVFGQFASLRPGAGLLEEGHPIDRRPVGVGMATHDGLENRDV